MMEEAVIAG